jgi:hypothetical protein
MRDPMWKQRWRAALAVMVLCIGLAPRAHAAAGSVTTTAISVGSSGTTRYALAWVSSAGGAVSGNALGVRAGYIYQVQFVPDGGGTQPTDLYDVLLNDPRSVDLLISAGANLSQTTSKLVQIVPAIYYDGVGDLDLVISNAGASKGGTVYVWVRP